MDWIAAMNVIAAVGCGVLFAESLRRGMRDGLTWALGAGSMFNAALVIVRVVLLP